MTLEKIVLRLLQTIFILAMCLVIALSHQRIKSCEDSIEDIQKIIYLNKKLKIPLVYPYKQYAKHKLGVENE
jgi:hypothetical protein